VFGFIELAKVAFGGWVGQLKERGEAVIDGSEITRQAELLKSGHEVTPAPAPQVVAPAPVEASVALPDPSPEPAEEPAAAPTFTFESLDLSPSVEPVQTESAPVVEPPAPAPLDFENLGLEVAAQHAAQPEPPQIA